VYSPEVRDKVRAAYVHRRLPLTAAAEAAGVPEQTARRWKRDAANRGDDWDRARAAARMAAGGIGDLTARVIEDFALLFEATVRDLKGDESLPPERKAEVLSRLADAYTKTVKAAGAVDPQLGRLAIALKVLELLASWLREHEPDLLEPFTRVLEPFGAHLTEELAA